MIANLHVQGQQLGYGKHRNMPGLTEAGMSAAGYSVGLSFVE